MAKAIFYKSSDLPPGFVYPPTYVDLRNTAAEDALYPWFFFEPYGEVGTLCLTLCAKEERSLVPFASLETGDGDTACFDGSDTKGDPEVVMFILDGSGRNYGFKNFEAWLAKAKSDAASF